MSRGKLFQVAILYHDPKGKTIVVKKPFEVIAASQQEAYFQGARAVPKPYADKPADLEILVVGWVSLGSRYDD